MAILIYSLICLEKNVKWSRLIEAALSCLADQGSEALCQPKEQILQMPKLCRMMLKITRVLAEL
jgi:hypothetical protein|tara:strand:- start:109 stop:300 length:192 start_codon:yes stop_codon:yes gene_type:complete